MSYPATPLRVKWSELGPTVYEDMVSALLSILHPTSIRTDGSGGDGGRDVHFGGPEGLEVFELKSFTGRLTKNRLGQVKRSFVRALGHDPKTWTVVCPIDLTNEERKKFESLTAGSGVKCAWLGKTWLDARMAEHPCVARYFLSDVTDEIRDLARLFAAERAALTNGVPDAIERLRALAERCDELDPFYRVDLATDTRAGTVTASLVPRYPMAAHDRPITLQAIFAFPDREAAEATRERFQAAYDFGVGVEVPAQYVARVVVDAPAGLGGEFGSGALQLGARELGDVPELRLDLRISAPDGTHVTTLPLSGRATNAGAKGIDAELADTAAGLLRAELRADWTEHVYHLRYRFEDRPCLPSALLPCLRFLAALKAPNSLTCHLSDGTALGPPLEITGDQHQVDERSVRTVQLLARVQDATSTWFDVPEEMTDADLADLVAANDLLEGRIVTGTWERWTPGVSAEHAAEMLENIIEVTGSLEPAMSLWQKSPEQTLVVSDHAMALGLVTTVMHSARLEDPDGTMEAVQRAQAADTVAFAFVPGSIDTFEMWRGAPENRPSAVPAA
ncbi:MAG TPA: hypothetical protein VKR22_07005 [Acidimicrobiales bacterium]|nr:hypothetical protein [Acidimicrobiales bacterium]